MILKRIRTEFFNVYLHDKVCLKWLESFQTHFHVYSSLYIPHYALLFTFLNYLCIFPLCIFCLFYICRANLSAFSLSPPLSFLILSTLYIFTVSVYASFVALPKSTFCRSLCTYRIYTVILYKVYSSS